VTVGSWEVGVCLGWEILVFCAGRGRVMPAADVFVLLFGDCGFGCVMSVLFVVVIDVGLIGAWGCY